ncbi:hypothetical protein [Gracilibacillus alcaliphilus]|uniref:hypothetical protein n=1 Tax=Gracilibacillus alcaliphilus TaxID=1401441 RepID=UPI001957B957|nr:hypothetical protein [Gracilibacillus alcaliphilus]MBM7675811.1 hypothetical protein [Gracilibacillus alcaliphilus]
MYRYELYSIEDIENLKKELNTYKQTIKTITDGNLLEDYLKTKDDFYHLKIRLLELEGDMKAMENNYQEEISNHQMEERHLASQFSAITASLQQLKQDGQLIKNKLEQLPWVELSEKINQLISDQQITAMEQKKELESLKGEIAQITEWMRMKEERAQNNLSPKRSEYKQLQGMLQPSNHVEQSLNKKNNQVNRQHYSRTKITNEKSYYTDPQQEQKLQNREKGKIRNAPYDLNRNIIIRKETPKSKSESKEAPRDTNHTLPNEEETISVQNNHLSHGNNITDEQIPSMDIEKTLTDDPESTEKLIESANSNTEHTDNLNKKSELSSFLSLFKKG